MNDLRVLVDNLLEAKAIEEAAKRRRIMIEELIAAEIPGPERGQRTVAVDQFKVKIERGYNYRADLPSIEKLQENGKIDFAPIKVKTTRELDVTGYHWYEEHDSDAFAALAECVVVTPRKISVIVASK